MESKKGKIELKNSSLKKKKNELKKNLSPRIAIRGWARTLPTTQNHIWDKTCWASFYGLEQEAKYGFLLLHS